MSPDFKEILSIFNDHEVRYLIVGAYAVMKYTEPRYTKDLDIWLEASEENAKKVFSSLRQFGAPLNDLTEPDFAQDGFFQMGRPPARRRTRSTWRAPVIDFTEECLIRI